MTLQKRIILCFVLALIQSSFSLASTNSCSSVFDDIISGPFIEFEDLNKELPSHFSLVEMSQSRPGLTVSVDIQNQNGVASFIAANPYMSFITVGDRILYLTRDPVTVRQFVFSERTYKKFLDAPKPLTIKEFQGFVAFDLSKSSQFNPLIRQLAGTYAAARGPNCWNLCMLYQGWTRTAYFMKGEEFGIWVDGPFATTVIPYSKDLSKGDIIVLRNRNFSESKMSEVHGAIALEQGLVLTKNGMHSGSPYEVMLFSDMLKLYLPGDSNSIEIKKIKRFHEVWMEWGPRINPALKSAVERWLNFESDHSNVFLSLKGKSRSKTVNKDWADAKALQKSLVQELMPIAIQSLKELEGRNLTETEMVEQFFWKLLRVRMTSEYFGVVD